jgi:hypothetical protein
VKPNLTLPNFSRNKIDSLSAKSEYELNNVLKCGVTQLFIILTKLGIVFVVKTALMEICVGIAILYFNNFFFSHWWMNCCTDAVLIISSP